MELLNETLSEDEKSLYSSFLKWYEAYQRNDVDGIMACVDENVLSIGTGYNEVHMSKKELMGGYCKDFEEILNIALVDPEVLVKARGDHGLVFLKAFNRVKLKGGTTVFYRTRRSIVCERKNGQWVHTHIHHSRPDPEQIIGRSFPVDPSMLSRYTLLFSASRDAILMIDSHTGDIIEANNAASVMYGLSNDELVHRNVRDVMQDDKFNLFMSKLELCTEYGDLFETQQMGPVGIFSCEISIRPAEIGNRKICVCIIRDVSERKEAERELKASKERLSLALESTKDGLWEVTFPERGLSISDYFVLSLGFNAGETLPVYKYDYWINFIYPGDVKRLNIAFARHVSDQEEVRVEFRMKKASGEWLWVMARGRLVYSNPDGSPGRMFGTVMDIDARKRREKLNRIKAKKLEAMASVDSLTGIMNRHKFNQVAQELISCSNKTGRALSLIMFDIDFFKNINDVKGHQEGDSILSQVCRLVRSRLRFTDVFARWGGDEFMILVSIEKKGALKIAENLRDLIDRAFKEDAKDVTASFGVASYETGTSLKAFSARADEALYRAKRNGRNQVSS